MPSDPPVPGPLPDEDDRHPAGGRARWTVPVPDARPRWAPLEVAWAGLGPRSFLTWSDAHRLPDGGRVDAFVRLDGGVVLLGEDGRPWTCSGVAPGAVGPSLLLVPHPREAFARLLLESVDDPVREHVRRDPGGRDRRGG